MHSSIKAVGLFTSCLLPIHGLSLPATAYLDEGAKNPFCLAYHKLKEAHNQTLTRII